MPTLQHSEAKMPINLALPYRKSWSTLYEVKFYIALPYRKSWSTLYEVKFLLRHIYAAKIIQKCPHP